MQWHGVPCGIKTEKDLYRDGTSKKEAKSIDEKDGKVSKSCKDSHIKAYFSYTLHFQGVEAVFC